jgi:hypothetical protein
MALCFFGAFLFEMDIDFNLLIGFWVVWLLMRLFTRNKYHSPLQVGDTSLSFALSSFFPEKARPTVDQVCNVSYTLFNACKLITFIQNRLMKPTALPDSKSKPKDNSKEKAKIKKGTEQQRKKALKKLDEEIEKKSGFARMIEAAKNFASGGGNVSEESKA